MERRHRLGDALYPLISKTHPTKAGIIISMILEMPTDEVIGYLEDLSALKKIVEEAQYLLSAPPSLSSRLKSSGQGPDTDLTSLGEQESMVEGGHDDDQREL